jgi:Dephospho-CoA kinase
MAENSSMKSRESNKQSVQPKVLGVTGTIASGKSLVGRLLAARGIPVVDTDIVVHEILAGDEVTKKAILDEFGKSVFLPESLESSEKSSKMPGLPAVDRKKLGAVVFSDESKRRKLEAIVHPNVVLACRRKVKEYGELGHKLVAILVPLLFEANLAGEYDEIWSVFTKEAVLKNASGKETI